MTYKENITVRVAREPGTTGLKRLAEACLLAYKAGLGASTIVVETAARSSISVQIDAAAAETGLAGPLLDMVNSIGVDAFDRIETAWAQWIVGNGTRLRATFKATPMAPTDDVIVSNAAVGGTEEQVRKVLTSLQVAFPTSSWGADMLSSLPPELKAFHLATESALASREAALVKGHGRLQELLERANETEGARRKALESDFAEKSAKDEERIRGRLAEVEEAERVLREERLKLDDRARTHARRAHEVALKLLLDSHRKYEPSPAAQAERRPIYFACAGAIIVALAIYATAITLLVRNGASVIEYGMLATATILGGSTLVYYLRWQDRWSTRQEQVELETRGQDLDFGRARWIVELLFEWRKEGESTTAFPAELLRSLAADLFQVGKYRLSPAAHPATDIAAFVDGLKSFEVLGKKGVSIERFPPSPTSDRT